MIDGVVKTYVPSDISQDELRLTNQSCTPRVSLQIDQGLSLHDRHMPWTGSWICYEGQIGDEPFLMFAALPLLAALTAKMGVSAGALSCEIQAMISILLMESGLAQLEQNLGKSIRLHRFSQQVPSATDRYGIMEVNGHNWPVALHASPAVLSALLDVWPVAPLPEQEVFVRTALCVGRTTLPLAVLLSLQIRDVVLFEEATPNQAILLVAGCAQVTVQWIQEQGWVLETTITYKNKKESQMTAHDDAAKSIDHDRTDEMMTSTDDLPVTLNFEMGQKTMSLAELKAVGPGSVMALASPVDAPIHIYVGGRCIGSGALVNVDGAAGVRVTRFFGRE